MALNRLVFDTTDANTIADSHHVGAHTLDGAGNLITSGDGDSDALVTTAIQGLDTRGFLFGYDAVGDAWDRLQQVSGALKVYIDDGDFSVDVKVDGVYDVGTNANPDNVGLISHVRGATPGDADQTFRSTGGAADADDVVAANVHGMDVNAFGMVFDGTTWDRLRGTAGAANVYETHDIALANTAILTTRKLLTAGGVAEALLASQAASRKYMFIANNDNQKMYIGPSGVAATTGYPIDTGSALENLRIGPAVSVHFVSAKTGHDARVMELS
jgi:hypothetical protein